MKKLYEYEQDYFDAYDRAIEWSESGCSLYDLVEDLGFNNITILNPNEEDIDKKDIENVYYGSDIYEKMDTKMINTRFILSSVYKDADGFTCAIVEFEDKENWKYFKEV